MKLFCSFFFFSFCGFHLNFFYCSLKKLFERAQKNFHPRELIWRVVKNKNRSFARHGYVLSSCNTWDKCKCNLVLWREWEECGSSEKNPRENLSSVLGYCGENIMVSSLHTFHLARCKTVQFSNCVQHQIKLELLGFSFLNAVAHRHGKRFSLRSRITPHRHRRQVGNSWAVNVLFHM